MKKIMKATFRITWFPRHINKIPDKNYKQLTTIKAAFHHMDEMKLIVIDSLKLDYAARMWFPYRAKDMRNIKTIQRTTNEAGTPL